jgi:hypothetical protein
MQMNLENLPYLYGPPAIVVQAFDEKRALTEIKTLVEYRDESRAGYKDSILQIGSWLIAARRAMPGRKIGGAEKFSDEFLAFIASAGIAMNTARQYMFHARNPGSLEAKRRADTATRLSHGRRKTLEEIVKALDNGFTADEVIAAIRKELNESK